MPFEIPPHLILMMYTFITALTLIIISSQYQVPCP